MKIIILKGRSENCYNYYSIYFSPVSFNPLSIQIAERISATMPSAGGTSSPPLTTTALASPITSQPFSYYEFAEADYDCFESIVNYAYSSQ